MLPLCASYFASVGRRSNFCHSSGAFLPLCPRLVSFPGLAYLFSSFHNDRRLSWPPHRFPPSPLPLFLGLCKNIYVYFYFVLRSQDGAEPCPSQAREKLQKEKTKIGRYSNCMVVLSVCVVSNVGKRFRLPVCFFPFLFAVTFILNFSSHKHRSLAG